jgi:hypothetical protein
MSAHSDRVGCSEAAADDAVTTCIVCVIQVLMCMLSQLMVDVTSALCAPAQVRNPDAVQATLRTG